MMVALLLSTYAVGQRSSRVIERACVDDVAFRVIAAKQRPDHCTIARFRQRHEAALAGLFGEVLELCADAGLVGVAVLAIQPADDDLSPRRPVGDHVPDSGCT
jgi:transposase